MNKPERLTSTIKECLFIVFASLFFIAPAQAQGLKIEGGDTITLIRKIPFDVVAPKKGECLFAWQMPKGVEFIDMGEKAMVTAAPRGKVLTIGVKCTEIDIDWGTKTYKFKHKFITETYLIQGEADPDPPEPDPDPPGPLPTDSIWNDLRSAYEQEPSATRDADIGKLAELYTQGADVAEDDRFSKVFEVNQTLAKARFTLIADRLPKLRGVLNEESNRILPTSPAAELTADNRALLRRTFERYAGLLRRLLQ